MMEYKLLDNGTGIILTRQPEIVSDMLYISFDGAPRDATAIITANGSSIYRLLEDGMCSIPASAGIVAVGIAELDGSAKPRRWICEGLKAEPLKDGQTLYAPNDGNLPETVAKLRLENQAIRESLSSLENSIKALREKFQKMMEGYDIT